MVSVVLLFYYKNAYLIIYRIFGLCTQGGVETFCRGSGSVWKSM